MRGKRDIFSWLVNEIWSAAVNQGKMMLPREQILNALRIEQPQPDALELRGL